MPVNAELANLLNVLHGNRSLVVTERQTVTRLESLPPDAGLSLIAGCTRLRNGETVDSVFELEADGGELHRVYWLIEGIWYDSADADARRRLASSDTELFPFDWQLAVPLQVDHFHGEQPPRRRPRLP